MIGSRLGELDSSLLPHHLCELKVMCCVLVPIFSSVKGMIPAWSWRAWHPSQPHVWNSCSFPFSLEGGVEIYSCFHMWIKAEETSLGLLWDLIVKYHCDKFLCTMAGLSMSFFFYVINVGNRKSEEPAVLRCLWKQAGKTSWRNQWLDFINGFSHFPEFIRNNSWWHW